VPTAGANLFRAVVGDRVDGLPCRSIPASTARC